MKNRNESVRYGTNQCKGKRQYSEMGALYALMRAQDENNKYRPIRKYKCQVCHKFHLTSQKEGAFK